MIETARLTVRIPDAIDVPEIVRYTIENREHLGPWDPARPPEYYSHAYWMARVPQIQAESAAGLGHRMFVFRRDQPRRVLGSLSLVQIQRGPLESGVIGYGLAESEQGNGYMSEAVEGVVRYAFDVLNLHRVEASYMPHNRRSAAVLRRAGFSVEGYARDYLLLAGRWEDHIMTARINPDWSHRQPLS